jgi:hypothetical protein
MALDDGFDAIGEWRHQQPSNMTRNGQHLLISELTIWRGGAHVMMILFAMLGVARRNRSRRLSKHNPNINC